MSSSAPERTPVNRRQLIGKLAAELGRDDLGPGPRAELRRMDISASTAVPALQRLFARVNIPEELLRGDGEVRWATIAQGMALSAPTGHRSDEPLGETLARAGVAENRVARLLAARGQGFRDQALLLARALAAKDRAMDWRDLGELVLVESVSSLEERAETLRLRLARAFYRTRDSEAAATEPASA